MRNFSFEERTGKRAAVAPVRARASGKPAPPLPSPKSHAGAAGGKHAERTDYAWADPGEPIKAGQTSSSSAKAPKEAIKSP